MEAIFEVLRHSKKSNQQSADLEGRMPFTQLGVVVDNQDPLNKRRVKVAMQNTGGQMATDWLWRSHSSPHHDPPLPRIGQTVEISFLDGDPHKGSYGGIVTNDPNPQREKADPEKDDHRWIEGNEVIEVQGKREITATEYTIHKTQLVMEDLLRLWIADALPSASPENRGKLAIVKGEIGVRPDKAYACMMSKAGAYTWVEWASGLNV